MKKLMTLGILFLSSMLLVSCGESSEDQALKQAVEGLDEYESRSKSSRRRTCSICREVLQTDGTYEWCINENNHWMLD